jgi:hypothetical protein
MAAPATQAPRDNSKARIWKRRRRGPRLSAHRRGRGTGAGGIRDRAAGGAGQLPAAALGGAAAAQGTALGRAAGWARAAGARAARLGPSPFMGRGHACLAAAAMAWPMG